jgi:hypothetical protein
MIRSEMKRLTEEEARGREAPIVVTPRALARLIRQTAEIVRRRGSRRRARGRG